MDIVKPFKRRQTNSDDALIPLINIVFLMLIFFMIAGSISRSDAIKIQPPLAASDNPLDGLNQPLSINVLLPAEGELHINDTPTAMAAVTDHIQSLIGENSDIEAVEVLIKVDADTPVPELQELLQQIKAAGLKQVSLATQRTAP